MYCNKLSPTKIQDSGRQCGKMSIISIILSVHLCIDKKVVLSVFLCAMFIMLCLLVSQIVSLANMAMPNSTCKKVHFNILLLCKNILRKYIFKCEINVMFSETLHFNRK